MDACGQELQQSQLHVRHLLETCCRHLATTFAPHPEGNAPQRMHARAKVGVGLTLALRSVLVHCPQSLIGLDLKPIQTALDATEPVEVGCFQDFVVKFCSAANVQQCRACKCHD